MTVRLAIRGYVNGEVKFEDRVEIQPDTLDTILPRLATEHAAAIAAHQLHMIEIEFLDEPDQAERFFRFGSDPAGMVMPIRIDLSANLP